MNCLGGVLIKSKKELSKKNVLRDTLDVAYKDDIVMAAWKDKSICTWHPTSTMIAPKTALPDAGVKKKSKT